MGVKERVVEEWLLGRGIAGAGASNTEQPESLELIALRCLAEGHSAAQIGRMVLSGPC